MRKLRRYEVDIRLYMDKEKKTLFKFIHWHTWARCLNSAKVIANLECKVQVRKYSPVKTFTAEVYRASIRS